MNTELQDDYFFENAVERASLSFFEQALAKAEENATNEHCISVECQGYEPNPNLETFAKEYPHVFLTALKRISPEMAQLLIEHVLLGRRQVDIARLHNIAQPTVSVLLKRAAKQLAEPPKKKRKGQRLRTLESVSEAENVILTQTKKPTLNQKEIRSAQPETQWFALEPANNFDHKLLPAAIQKLAPDVEVFLHLDESGEATYCYVRCSYAALKTLKRKLKTSKYIRRVASNKDGVEITIPDADVQTMCDLYDSSQPNVAEGAFVRIKEGIAAEFCGYVVEVARNQITVRIELLNKTVMATVGTEDITDLSHVPETHRVFYYGPLIQELRSEDLLRPWRFHWKEAVRSVLSGAPDWVEWVRPVLAGSAEIAVAS